MDNEVVIHVRSVNDTAAGFNAARQNAHKTASDIEGEFAAGGKRSGKKLADGITEGTNNSGNGVGEKITRGVEQKLAEARGRFRKSGETVGDDIGAGTGIKLGKGLLSNFGKALPEMGRNISTEFSAIAAQSTPILAGIGVAAAPFIGAALSAGIIGGAGVGGVIGGVMLAARDPRVAAAGQSLGNTINSQLTRDATPFIQPTLNAIKQLQRAFDQNDSHIQNIFKNSARYVEPLTDGITGLMSGLLRGLDALTANAGPVIGAIGKGLTEVGNSLGDALTMISSQGDGAAAALGDLFGAVSAIIQVVGPLLAGLTAVYGVLSKIGATQGLMETLAGPIGMIAGLFNKTKDSAEGATVGVWHAAESMDGASTATTALYTNMLSTTASMDDLARSARTLTDQNNSLYSSTTDVASAMMTASKEIGKNGRTLDLNTEKGISNRKALSSVAGALQKNYDNYVKVNGVGPKSAALADTLRGKFIALAQKAGLSAGAAKNLANQILGIPDSKNTKITAQAAQALEAAREVRRAISMVQSKTVTLTIARRVTGSGVSDSALQSALNKQQASGGISGAANGSTSSGWTWVGEHGPELVRLSAGSSVKSAGDSKRFIGDPVNGMPSKPAFPQGGFSGAPASRGRNKTNPHHGGGGGGGGGGGYGDGGGGSVGPIYITLQMDGRQLTMAMVDPMRDYIRTAFGGSVQRAYGRN